MRRVVLIVVRLALAVVFLWAAIAKIREPWLVFAANIDSLHLLPEQGVLFVARTLPWAELVLGIALLLGIQLKYVAPFATALLLAFFAIMLRSYAQGLTVDCGCFGPGEALGPKTLARDGALLALSGWLTFEAVRMQRTAGTLKFTGV